MFAQNKTSITTAVILAAGQGVRLQSGPEDPPKGLWQLGGETLLARSIRILRGHGIGRILIAIGYQGSLIQRAFPEIECIENPAYHQSGSMESLNCILPNLQEDFLLLESDLLYESRAIAQAIQHPSRNLVLASTPTQAGDEVWVDAPNGRVRDLSKTPPPQLAKINEFVGINRLSMELAQHMKSVYQQMQEQSQPNNISYETDALVKAAEQIPIELLRLDGLIWGELDTLDHYNRLQKVVLPQLTHVEPPAYKPLLE